MHNLEIRTTAVTMARSGTPNAEIARTLGLPPGTIGAWKFKDRADHPELYPLTRAQQPYCPSCHGARLDGFAYSYLLGLYLGDGCITHASAHRVSTLTIACADAWPGLMDLAADAVAQVAPPCSVMRVARTGMHEVKAYSKHWPCLFPQHGPGMKHTRRIALTDWQRAIVERHPWQFIRGLVHSDGCRITNWTEQPIAGEIKRYEYPRYFFSNVSDDIRGLFCWALELVGVEWRRTNRVSVSVARRASVALMDEHVGPKF